MKKKSNAGLKTPGSKIAVIDGFLSVLYTDSGTFKSLTKRTVFRFYTEHPDLLTLHGWSSDSDIYHDDPNIKLNEGSLTNFQYGNKTYFGNLVLKINDLKKIKRQIKTDFKSVLFVPLDPQATDQGGQITYDIQLTNDDPLIVPFSSTPTGVSLNPSPPRNSG
ncbi:MAG: hypothetical protein ABI863_16870 [Ginsengibacter sp.]